jgi:hypothetical protein
MVRAERILLFVSILLLGGGWFLYDLGSRLNLADGKYDLLLWEQAPGDKWLYVGGVMMLISGSLAAAAFRLWKNTRREKQVRR